MNLPADSGSHHTDQKIQTRSPVLDSKRVIDIRLALKKILLVAGAPVLATGSIAGLFAGVWQCNSIQAQAASDSQTRSVVLATDAFLGSLSDSQRAKVQFPFTTEKIAKAARFSKNGSAGNPGTEAEPGVNPGIGPPGGFVGEQYGQAVWSNFPVTDVPRPGLHLGDLSASQRDAAMHLLQVVLSPKGYQKVLDIMGSDQALHDSGTPYCSGTACYTIGIFGTPSATRPWMLEFGGHHLGLNVTIAGEHGVLTPTLTGAQPSVYTSNGKTVRALAQENDKAFALLNALNPAQRKQAILNYRIGDLVLGPGQIGQVIQPEGLKASKMNAQQQAMLLDVIAEWATIVNDVYAKPRMEDIKARLDDTWFAWSGPTTHEPNRNGSAYYRIQGPTVVIEFSPQDTAGDATLHVHTMYRDPTNDYGIKFTGAD